MSNNITTNIKSKIYEIRGKQVLLDTDLANLYQVETKRINEAVKNNHEKFPERYYFRITENEFNSLKSNFSTSKGGSRKGHSVFTEQGVYMLATILKSSIATEVTIRIMDTFVEMRKYISGGLIELDYINKKVVEHDNKLKLLENFMFEFNNKDDIELIYFEKQYYKSYSKLINIFKRAKKTLIIIDNFINNETLDIISKLANIKVTIITDKNTCYIKEIDINKYNKEFNNLKVIYNKTFHDRFFIIDKKDIYHCGASIKDLGNKTFAINKLTEESTNKPFINKVNNIVNKN